MKLEAIETQYDSDIMKMEWILYLYLSLSNINYNYWLLNINKFKKFKFKYLINEFKLIFYLKNKSKLSFS